MGLGLPFGASDLLFWGGVGFTAGTLLKQAEIAKFGGYGVMIGVIWSIATNYLGISI